MIKNKPRKAWRCKRANQSRKSKMSRQQNG